MVVTSIALVKILLAKVLTPERIVRIMIAVANINISSVIKCLLLVHDKMSSSNDTRVPPVVVGFLAAVTAMAMYRSTIR